MYDLSVSVCTCRCLSVFATDLESGEDERFRDGLVCFWQNDIAPTTTLLPPFPPFSLASLLRQIQQIGKKWRERRGEQIERESGLDVTSRLC